MICGYRRIYEEECVNAMVDLFTENYLYRSDQFGSSTFKHLWPLLFMMREPEVELRFDGPRLGPLLTLAD